MSTPPGDSASASLSPHEEYVRRRGERNATVKQWRQWDVRIANLRLLVFCLAVMIAGLGYAVEGISYAWIAVPALAFFVLVVLHERVHRDLVRARAAVRFYDVGIARLEHRWHGTGIAGADLAPETHLYAEDLDIFGEGSLFELMCTARTRSGEETLAGWLLAPASTAEIARRQEAVDELRTQLDLRERFALIGGEVRVHIRPESLMAWGSRQPVFRRSWTYPLAVGLTVLILATGTAWWQTDIGPLPFLGAVLVVILFMRAVKEDVQAVMQGVDRPLKDLQLLSRLLVEIEQATFHAERLRGIQSALGGATAQTSRRIRALARCVGALDAYQNELFRPFGFFVLWPVHATYAIERWRARHGAEIGTWLKAVGEFEALSALATFAFERPGALFPEIVEDGPVYQGIALRHPLLAESICVPNDVDLGESTRLLIVSGSNMSGKSTLLRVVGTNAVLAMCGAPVCAESLRISRLAVGASLHVIDSIQEGRSHFYAEILRLKAMADMCKNDPVLFLIDEILHGTNSHDRRIGSEAILKSLVDGGAVGLVTTHDLALTKIEQALGAATRNVHFEDRFEENRLVFDYKMRPGVVEKSNALSLMRAIGLDV